MISLTKVLVLNGPNLNKLGSRESSIYGYLTLYELDDMLVKLGLELSLDVTTLQSNHEGVLIDHIHNAEENNFKYIIFNPAAYTHYSYALRDAVSSISVPVLEVHLSNISSREEFRQISVIAPVSCGQIMGLGYQSYELALYYIFLQEKELKTNGRNETESTFTVAQIDEIRQSWGSIDN